MPKSNYSVKVNKPIYNIQNTKTKSFMALPINKVLSNKPKTNKVFNMPNKKSFTKNKQPLFNLKNSNNIKKVRLI